VGEADVSGLAGGDMAGRRWTCSPAATARAAACPTCAVMPDPVDRGDRPLGVVLIGGREDSRLGGKAKLEQIDPVAEADQVIPSSAGVKLEGRARDEALDGLEARSSGFPATSALHIPVV